MKVQMDAKKDQMEMQQEDKQQQLRIK